uniref:Uncharacterized protein n=1 Tax=Macrostomum lignano TaxID=282301 RepID=A0A1I8GWN9_9PLAT
MSKSEQTKQTPIRFNSNNNSNFKAASAAARRMSGRFDRLKSSEPSWKLLITMNNRRQRM